MPAGCQAAVGPPSGRKLAASLKIPSCLVCQFPGDSRESDVTSSIHQKTVELLDELAESTV
jgi:hypothetical protein